MALRKLLTFAVGGMLLPDGARAHGIEADGDHGHLVTLDPAVIVPLIIFTGAYLCGVVRLWRRAGIGHGLAEWRLACFFGSTLALLLALVWPLDALGKISLSGHMAQHVMLTVVAAPLLVLSTPGVACLWAVPAHWRTGLGRFGSVRKMSRVRQALTHPIVAWGCYATMLWIWHTPRMYEGALRDEAVHLAEHFSFLGSAALLWWAILFSLRNAGYGASRGVLILFATALQSGLLGALLTFARQPLYPFYDAFAPLFGTSALEDQQVAGVFMWVPGGFVYMTAGLAVTSRWLLRVRHDRANGQAGGAE